jgi:hypothetical protein
MLPRAFTSEQVKHFLAEYGYTANPRGLAGPFPVEYISENMAYVDVNAEAVRKGDDVPERPVRITTYLIFDGVSTRWKLKSVEELAKGIETKCLDRDKFTPKILPWPR